MRTSAAATFPPRRRSLPIAWRGPGLSPKPKASSRASTWRRTPSGAWIPPCSSRWWSTTARPSPRATKSCASGAPPAAILSAERVALNFLQRLSGIATATSQAVRAAQGTRAIIVDTRKTTPGLRVLEKYAVRVGGGRNHRFGLDDAVMIKENHIAVAGGITQAVQAARAYLGHMHKIQVEVETLAQVEEAVAAGADAILLDNMDLETMAEAVRLVAGRAIVEASGGIRPENVADVARTGVDVISLGWLTHSAPALDLSLLVTVEHA